MRKLFVALITIFALTIPAMTLASASGKKGKAITTAAVTVDATQPTVASVPVMEGYDVQNWTTEPRELSIASIDSTVVTTARWRLSSTRPLCSKPPVEIAANLEPEPAIVLRA